MASLRISGSSPAFPEGTLLSAYLRRRWPGQPPQPGDSPRGEASGAEVVNSHGEALIEGLEDGEFYYVGGQVNGVWHWKTAATPAPTEGGSSGGGGGGVDSAAVLAILGSQGVVKAREINLGNVSGNVTPNMAEAEVFAMSLTADTTALAPINVPAGSRATYCELKITTNGHKLNVAGITKWVGGETPYGLDGSVPALRLMLVTDNATTFEGLSMDQLPSDIVHCLVGADGTVPTASGGHWTATAPLAPGLSQAQVDTRIALLALLNGGHAMTAADAAEGADEVLVTTGTNEARWEKVLSLVAEHAPFRVSKIESSTSKALVPNRYYVITKKATLFTLPVAEAAADGETIIIENTSNGTIELEGAIGSEAAGTKVVIQPGEALVLWGREALKEWRIVARRAAPGDIWLPDVNTAGKSSAQITKAYEEAMAALGAERPPRAGNALYDRTNHLALVFEGPKWFKSAAYTEIA